MATLKESLIIEFEELIKSDSEIKKIIKSSSIDENRLLGLFIEILNNKRKSMDEKDHPNIRDAVSGVNNYIKQNFNEN